MFGGLLYGSRTRKGLRSSDTPGRLRFLIVKESLKGFSIYSIYENQSFGRAGTSPFFIPDAAQNCCAIMKR